MPACLMALVLALLLAAPAHAGCATVTVREAGYYRHVVECIRAVNVCAGPYPAPMCWGYPPPRRHAPRSRRR